MIIQIDAGTYRQVVVLKNKPYVQLIGAGGSPSDTVVVFDVASGTAASSSTCRPSPENRRA